MFEILLEDIKKMGLPTVHNFRFGWNYTLHPIGYETEHDYIIKFIINENSFFEVCSNYTELQEISRPDNLIIECEKCYRIIRENTNEPLGYLYWTKD
jgi:hypothetical protein